MEGIDNLSIQWPLDVQCIDLIVGIETNACMGDRDDFAIAQPARRIKAAQQHPGHGGNRLVVAQAHEMQTPKLGHGIALIGLNESPEQ